MALFQQATNISATYRGIDFKSKGYYEVRRRPQPKRILLRRGHIAPRDNSAVGDRPSLPATSIDIFSWCFLRCPPPLQYQLRTGIKSFYGKLYAGDAAIEKLSVEPFVAPMLQASEPDATVVHTREALLHQ